MAKQETKFCVINVETNLLVSAHFELSEATEAANKDPGKLMVVHRSRLRIKRSGEVVFEDGAARGRLDTAR